MTQKTITEEEFEAHYKPNQNHLVKDAPMNGWLYETGGVEFDYVRSVAQVKPENVWTVLETDGATVISNGLMYVNRIGYIITDVPVEDAIDFVDVSLDAPRVETEGA